MNIYFAYKMTAAINICVNSHKTLNGLHKLFPGNKRISSLAIEMHLAGAESNTALWYMTTPHWGLQNRVQFPAKARRGIWTGKVKLSKRNSDHDVGSTSVTLGNTHYWFVGY